MATPLKGRISDFYGSFSPISSPCCEYKTKRPLRGVNTKGTIPKQTIEKYRKYVRYAYNIDYMYL